MSAGDGIRCQLCCSDTQVIETRQNVGSLRRRRRCLRDGCRGRLTTVEMIAPSHGKNATTTELVAMPSHVAADLEVVPRELMRRLRELLQIGTSAEATEEHW